MKPLRQLYDEQGQPLAGKGATKQETLEGALLHGNAHIWVWRKTKGGAVELLLQRRANTKLTWPGLLDISAAGHIDLGETPLQAALREAEEELDLKLQPADLYCYGVNRCYLPVDDTGLVEQEFQWLYLVESSDQTLKLRQEEVGEVLWRSLSDCRADWSSPETARAYVPHGTAYFTLLLAALDRLTQSN